MTEGSQLDHLAIRDIRQRTMRAENTGDFDFFNFASADDIVVMPPGMTVVVGREATVAFMREFLSHFDLNIRYVSEETRVHGDLAYDRGTYSQTLTPKAGGTPIPENGKFLWLYSRGSDGSWKISRVMWNATAASLSEK